MRRDVRLLRRCPGRHRQAGSEDSSPEDFFSHNGKHHQIPKIHIPARPVQKPLPIYVAGNTEAMFRAAARHGHRVLSSGRVGVRRCWPSSTRSSRTLSNRGRPRRSLTRTDPQRSADRRRRDRGRKAGRGDSGDPPGPHVFFVQGRLHLAQGGDALNGADDERGQAAGRAGTRCAHSQRSGLIPPCPTKPISQKAPACSTRIGTPPTKWPSKRESETCAVPP